MDAQKALVRVLGVKPHDVLYDHLNKESAGFRVTNFAYEEAGGSAEIKQTQTSSSFEGLPVDHARFLENYEHFLDSRRIFTDPNTGNHVGTYWANRDQLTDHAEDLVAIVTTWTSSMETNGGNRREYALVAAMNPEVSFVVVDNPGSGFSDRLPDDVMDHTKDSWEFDEAAAIISRALAADDFYPKTYMGVSTGGRYAIAAARTEAADNIEQIGAIDPPGQSDFGPLKLTRRMIAELIIHGPRFAAASEDPYVRPHETFGTPEAWEEMVGPKELGDQLRRNRAVMQKFWYLPRAMSKRPGLSADIVAALGDRPEAHLVYVSPEKSELVDYPKLPATALQTYLTALALRAEDGKFIERVQTILVPQATHYFTAAYPRRVGELASKIINGA